MEVVLCLPTSLSEVPKQSLGLQGGWGLPPGWRGREAGDKGASPRPEQGSSQTLGDRQGPRGGPCLVTASGSASLPSPARRPPLAGRLAGPHSCALPAAARVTHGPGSHGTPGLVLGPAALVFLFGNSLAACAPTSPCPPGPR